MKWINFEHARPRHLDKVEVKGHPTSCCELDMEEEGIYVCIFENDVSSYRIGDNNEIKDLNMSEIFYVDEDEPRRHMEIVLGWRPYEMD